MRYNMKILLIVWIAAMSFLSPRAFAEDGTQVKKLAFTWYVESEIYERETLAPAICADLVRGEREWIQCWTLGRDVQDSNQWIERVVRVFPVDEEGQNRTYQLPTGNLCAFADLSIENSSPQSCFSSLVRKNLIQVSEFTLGEDRTVKKVAARKGPSGSTKSCIVYQDTSTSASDASVGSVQSERQIVECQQQISERYQRLTEDHRSIREYSDLFVSHYPHAEKLTDQYLLAVGKHISCGLFADERVEEDGAEQAEVEMVEVGQGSEAEVVRCWGDIPGENGIELNVDGPVQSITAGVESAAVHMASGQAEFVGRYAAKLDGLMENIGGRADQIALGPNMFCVAQGERIRCRSLRREELALDVSLSGRSGLPSAAEYLPPVSLDSTFLQAFFTRMSEHAVGEDRYVFRPLVNIAEERVKTREEALFLLIALRDLSERTNYGPLIAADLSQRYAATLSHFSMWWQSPHNREHHFENEISTIQTEPHDRLVLLSDFGLSSPGLVDIAVDLLYHVVRTVERGGGVSPEYDEAVQDLKRFMESYLRTPSPQRQRISSLGEVIGEICPRPTVVGGETTLPLEPNPCALESVFNSLLGEDELQDSRPLPLDKALGLTGLRLLRYFNSL